MKTTVETDGLVVFVILLIAMVLLSIVYRAFGIFQ